MKTLVLFVPKENSGKIYEDFKISDKTLRLIYYKKGITGFNFRIYRLKIRKLIRNCEILNCDFSALFKGRKIYRSGHLLVYYHLAETLKMLQAKSPITVFSSNEDDIDLISPVLMSFKNVRFVVPCDKTKTFSEKLLDEFGITGAVSSVEKVFGHTVVIMPGGEIFSPEGAETIINLSKTHIPLKNISPENILFSAPKNLRYIPHFMRRADIIETMLTFFESDFSTVRPISVNFDK